MRQQDRRVFLTVSNLLQLWIIVRDTNPESLHYIGCQGYVPKAIDCKAKTANRNVNGRILAGLVASPILHPMAFNDLAKAREEWAKMHVSESNPTSGSYSLNLDQKSPHYGCLQHHRQFIHGDYDLYDIVDINSATRNLALVSSLSGSPHMVGAHFGKVQKEVNQRIGVPMVQHGGEAQFKDHSSQQVWGFCPDGTEFSLHSETAIREFYKVVFEGRENLKINLDPKK